MNPEVREAIEAHARREFPRECCGVVVDGTRYIACRNRATTASEHFILHPEDYADAADGGEVTHIVHSHPNIPPRPSQGDLVSCETTGLPWYIVAVWMEPGDLGPRITGDHLLLPSGYEAPLVGREFFFGVLDCYTLIRDWYLRERNIELPNFERRDNFWNKKGNEVDLYAQYEEAGFEEVTGQPLQVGDVILMQIRAPFANHAGVYIGDGLMLHHLYGRLSERVPYSHSYYQENTRRIVRRKA